MDITVEKTALLDALRTNRTAHVELFQQAIEKYRLKAIAWFEDSILTIKQGGEVQVQLRLPIPEEHTDDFDRAIEMIEWHQGDSIELTEHQFENFVRNRWDWHRTFTSNTASYVS